MVSVLHIWNIAGVASVIAKYQKKLLKWDTNVVMRRQWDPYEFTTYGELWDVSSPIFYLKSSVIARKYHVIHVHALDKMIKWLKILYRRKCIVLHYHGSDIRGKWVKKKHLWLKADLVLVSTPDLYKEAPSEYKDDLIYYLPNPIDTELFKPLNIKREKDKALYIYKPGYPYSEIEWAKEMAKKYNLELVVIDASKIKIKHYELPLLLNKYEYFIDRRWIKSLSKLALEALACGCKVINWNGEIVEKLPPEHLPKNVVDRLRNLYEEKCVLWGDQK